MNLPKPPAPGSWSDEDDQARDQDAAEAQISLAWQDALAWAQRGDLQPLAGLLRSDNSLQDNREVRNFLADLLDGKVKRPRGKPARRPKMTFAIDTRGKIQWIDRRDAERLEIARWMREHKAIHGNKVYEVAAKHFKINEESLRNMIRRSSNAWKRSRST
jgi:hypothetical protein